MYIGSRSKSKFSNQAVTVGGLEFDSKLEQRIYSTLILIPTIEKVELHKSFDLIVGNKKICAVEPDFTVTLKTGLVLYGDAKSKPTETEVSKLKFKLFHVLYGKKIWILPREMSDFLALCCHKDGYQEFFEVNCGDTNA